MWGNRGRGHAVRVVAAVLAAAALAACGGGGSGSGVVHLGDGGTASGTASATTADGTGVGAPVAERATALDGLGAFLAEVDRTDARLHEVAGFVNADVTAKGVRARPQTVAAIYALDLKPLAKALPAGAGTALTRASMLVFSNLSSRAASFRGVPEGFAPVGSEEYAHMRECLANGARAQARFAADLAALRRLAAASPAFVPAAAGSRAAGEIALQTALAVGGNTCCGSCGGYVDDELSPVVWRAKEDPVEGHTDGTIGVIEFEASYTAAAGWKIELHAG